MSLLERIRQARLVRVLLVYLGASWVVIEAADLLQDQLSLPDWVVPVTIILLLVGLVVVGATAWVQGSPTTDQREAAGEVPTDWELDLPDLARSLRGGRLPHLTWGRALTGGLVAFLALFGLAALLFSGDDGPGPAELMADPAAPALAVLPFRASGPDLASWREGMVDLLSRNLDGLGALRAIDSRTVLARWSEIVGDGGTPDLADALAVASRTGARWALMGSAVEVGPRVRVSADVYDVAAGDRLAGASAEGTPDSLFSLVDALSVDVARALLEREDPDLSGLRLSSITTESPQALRSFLAGEASYRRMSFREAIDSYERAVELDPGFALAHYRLGSARGWVSGPADDSARRAAYEHRARLPEREALMVEAEYRSRTGRLPSGVALLREGVRRYPDDPEIWYQLGDIYIHWGPQLLISPGEAERALSRAVELDPGFAPYRIHLVDLALARGDSAAAARHLEIETRLAGPESREVRVHQLAYDFLFGGEAARERVRAALDTIPTPVVQWLQTPFSLDGERAGDLLTLANAACADRIDDPETIVAMQYFCLWTHVANGQIEAVKRYADRLGQRGITVLPAGVSVTLRQTGMDPSAPLLDPDSLLATVGEPEDGAGLVDPAYFMIAILALERGRLALADSIIDIHADAAVARTAQGDTVGARLVRGLAEGLEGYRALAAEEPDSATRHLEESLDLLAGSIGPESVLRNHVVWPLAGLYARAGRDREALRLYASLWTGFHAGPALIRRAEIHDRLGETERADSLWAHFLALWSGADPEHPMVQRAQRELGPG